MRLRQAPVDATPRLELAHRVPGSDVYRLHPITARRPSAGTVDTATPCGTCGETVPLRLSSAEWVRSQRNRQLLLGVTVLLVQAGGGVLLIVWGIRLGWSILPALLGFLLVMLTPFTTGEQFRDSREEDGAVSLDPGHTLREPGNTYDHVDSDGGNYEAGL
ncbi:hypothetical protein QLQ12_21920 [Actinoplanes sp. NEAU-A12]|uniref:Uncharacterized protein n=1 Tax=Actinoplanes sandaracinus TaxID=3045177 RepID=A0ABT6WNE6_9ACTN|nr:hypothetical protein [Actinoplanes sandaracinus]MDI6101276.1 hypothetical protein [Actinoplanes sandaracinus]